jgi:hypothetical protein
MVATKDYFVPPVWRYQNTTTTHGRLSTVSSPFEIFGSQKPNDDDGQVIDSFFIETDTPPDLTQALETIPIPAKDPIEKPTRTLSGTEILTSAFTPYMLLAPDADRTTIAIGVYSYATTPGVKDYALMADENSKVSTTSAQGSFRLRHNQVYSFSGHTGAIWITPGPILTDNIEITWRVVTK